MITYAVMSIFIEFRGILNSNKNWARDIEERKFDKILSLERLDPVLKLNADTRNIEMLSSDSLTPIDINEGFE